MDNQRNTSIKNRGKLNTKLCKNKFQNQHLFNFYKKYRNLLTHVKELSKQIFYENRSLEEKGNITTTWAVINELLIKKTTKQ